MATADQVKALLRSYSEGNSDHSLVRNRLHAFLPSRLGWKSIRQAAKGLSHAEIACACNDAAKDCILDDRNQVATAGLVFVLRERQRVDEGGNE